MTVPRSRKEVRLHRKYRSKVDKSVCVFCSIKKGDKQFIAETTSFKIIRNSFPYSLWDDQRVVDHLMILPKQHTDSLSDLTASQATEFLRLVSEYEHQVLK